MYRKQPCVYILASKKDGVLYIGVTSDLVKRLWEHQNNTVEGFTKKYYVHKLVFFELYDSMDQAIVREKQMKKWKREWKTDLIEKSNPDWIDLTNEIV